MYKNAYACLKEQQSTSSLKTQQNKHHLYIYVNLTVTHRVLVAFYTPPIY